MLAMIKIMTCTANDFHTFFVFRYLRRLGGIYILRHAYQTSDILFYVFWSTCTDGKKHFCMSVIKKLCSINTWMFLNQLFAEWTVLCRTRSWKFTDIVWKGALIDYFMLLSGKNIWLHGKVVYISLIRWYYYIHMWLRWSLHKIG